ncbi:MAG: DnaD domain protein [Lachnospiraceae bacterium]|nr:DnaD domain protein [Lachnospiraceae bacterium]
MTDSAIFSIEPALEPSHLAVSTVFIDRYMPSANGTFVKIYLSLLLCEKTRPEQLTLTYLADLLGETISDIYRGIQYWEREGLLRVTEDAEGNIVSLQMIEPEEEEAAAPAPAKTRKMARSTRAKKEAPVAVVPQEKADLDSLLAVIECYLGRTLTKDDTDFVDYLYEELHFSEDLIDYLYEYCVGVKKTGRLSYIRTVALGWHKAGITTPAEAANETALYTTEFQVVNKAFGLNRAPGKAERDYLNRWFRIWGFSSEMVEEACSRTLLSVSRPDFKYADGILKKWQEAGVFTKEALAQADAAHQLQASQEGEKKSRTRGVKQVQTGVFYTFPQRESTAAEDEALEKKLLKKNRKE